VRVCVCLNVCVYVRVCVFAGVHVADYTSVASRMYNS